MSFYIVIKGKITNFDFKYLSGKARPRVAQTQIHGETKGLSQSEIKQNNKEVFAIEIMTKEFESLGPANTAVEAWNVMNQNKIHHLPIMVDGLLTGLISNTDLPKIDDEKKLATRLHKLMSETVLCASESTPLRHILQVFHQEKIRCLPIVDQNMFVVGIVTMSDLFKWIIENQKFYKN